MFSWKSLVRPKKSLRFVEHSDSLLRVMKPFVDFPPRPIKLQWHKWRKSPHALKTVKPESKVFWKYMYVYVYVFNFVYNFWSILNLIFIRKWTYFIRLIVSSFLFQLQLLGAVLVYTESSVKRRQTFESYQRCVYSLPLSSLLLHQCLVKFSRTRKIKNQNLFF